MAFNFGAGARPTFGAAATTASTGLFGSAATATPAATGFSFGSSNQIQPAGFGFGAAAAPTASTAPFGGFGFGGVSSAAPTLGFGTTTSSTGFGFGLGGSTSTASTGFGTGLGTGTTPAFGSGTSGTGFGTGGFGSGLGTSTAGGFGTGLGTGTSGGFGTGLGTGTMGGFGTGLGTGTLSGFGTTGMFGGGTSGGTTGFGTGFGTGSTSGFGTGLATGFGAGTNFGPGGLSTSTFGANAGLKPGATTFGASAALPNVTAVTFPVIFNDERDMVIAKWNQLQACWGTGKGYYGNQPGQCVEFTSDNPHCFFKAVGYSCIPESKNEDGLVSLIFSRKQNEVCDNQQQIVVSLHNFLGAKSNLMVCVEGVKPLADDRTEMVIYIQDRQVTGLTNRILASEISQFLNQDAMKNQLATQLSICSVFAKVAMTPDQLKLYLSNPPAGIDSRIWEQAKLDNPDPEKLIPVPMVGFTELHSRLKRNEQEAHLHQLAQDMIASDIVQLQNNLTNMIAKTEQAKRRQTELSHRLLKVIVKQEIHRKHGYAIQADEELLRAHLEAIVAELNSPTQLKGRLNEIMSQMRMQNLTGTTVRPETGYQIDANIQEVIKQHLKQQNEGIVHLMNIIREDLEDIKLIEQGLNNKHSIRR